MTKKILMTLVALMMSTQCAFADYVDNTNTYKFHDEDCWQVTHMADRNKYFTDDRRELVELGMEPCKKCRP